MNFKHATWRKLYVEETGSFARLPFTARAYAKQLILLCDDAGRIDVGDGPDADAVKRLVDAAGFRMGATRGDRRMMAMMFPMLFDEGYLVAKGRHVIIRNYVAAQRRWDAEGDVAKPDETPKPDPKVDVEIPRPSNEAATKLPRSCNDRATKLQRPSNEAATKPELSTRKHDSETASARACARSSVPISSDTNLEEPPIPPASGTQPAEPVQGVEPKPPKADEHADAIRDVFDHWRSVMAKGTRAVLNKKRESKIRARLGEGYSTDELKRAIDGCKASPHHQGQNDTGAVYDDIELICRDQQHVDLFLSKAAPAKHDASTGSIDSGFHKTGELARLKAMGAVPRQRPRDSPQLALTKRSEVNTMPAFEVMFKTGTGDARE